MSIIPANQIGGLYHRNDIVECFCDNLMSEIQKKAKEGQNCCVFDATVYYNKRNGKITGNLPKGYNPDEYDCYKYSFDSYKDEVKERFESYGYVVKPTGYIGGIWQDTEDIYW